MVLLRDEILGRLDRLPERELREVLDFVEFLTSRTARHDDPVLAVVGILQGTPLSAEEIEQELYGDFTPTSRTP
jgi:hypothetical protein